MVPINFNYVCGDYYKIFDNNSSHDLYYYNFPFKIYIGNGRTIKFENYIILNISIDYYKNKIVFYFQLFLIQISSSHTLKTPRSH